MITDFPVSFELPGNLAIKTFIASLAEKFPLQLTAQYYAVKIFYDSFDWRLYHADLLCEFNQAKNYAYLNLSHFSNGQPVARIDVEKVPAFVTELEESSVVRRLQPILEMRALLPVAHLTVQHYQLNILNNDQKTVARLEIEEYEELKHRISLESIKGYDKATLRLSQFLAESLNLKVVNKPVLIAALKIQGRSPGDYASKLTLKLDPTLSAVKAVKRIYSQLLQAIKLNEQGAINAIDSEFLHDFRVAVRKTRAGLSQLKAATPVEMISRYSEFFAWLGQITNVSRDLDVYLLNFAQYQAALPLSIRDDLTPLRDFLKFKQTAAQKELANQLTSKKYLTQLIAWENYLKQPLEQTANPRDSQLSIKQLADLRIWKVYQRVIKEGSRINDQSPAIALHNLRKTCKKLRYLIEFFQSFYPNDDIKVLLKALKELQESLGDFQDCAVQEQTLKHFSEEMLENGYPSQTFLAIGVLIQVLDQKSCKARSEFSERFAVFATSKNNSLFKSLFINKA